MRRRKILPPLAVAAAALAVLAIASPASAVWTHKTRLTRTPASEEYPRIAAAGCFVHVVWIDLDHRDLHYARSSDAGATWSEPLILATGAPLRIIQAEVVATGRQVHVVWQQGAYDQASIRHRRSTNRGRTWRKQVSFAAPGRSAERPTLALASGKIYVAWIQTRRGSDTKPVKLFWTRSASRGKRWSVPRQLGRRSLGLSSPLLAAGDGRLHLFWGRHVHVDGSWDLQILHRSIADLDERWGPRTVAVEGGWRPSSVAIHGNTVHLAWQETQYKRSFVRYERSLDGGRTWSAVGVPLEDDASHAALGVAGDRLEAVWINDWDGTGAIVYGRSTDGGTSWSRRRWLARSARFPTLAVADVQGPCGAATHLAYGRRWSRNGHTFQEVFYQRRPRFLSE